MKTVCIPESFEDCVGVAVRELRGWRTLEEFSRVTGISPATLSRLERGESSTRFVTLWQLCKGSDQMLYLVRRVLELCEEHGIQE